MDKDEWFIIPPNIFEVKKPFLLLELLYFKQNEITSEQIIKKFHQFTGEKYIAVKWLTKKVKSHFSLKVCNLHSLCKIYKVYPVVEKFALVKPLIIIAGTPLPFSKGGEGGVGLFKNCVT